MAQILDPLSALSIAGTAITIIDRSHQSVGFIYSALKLANHQQYELLAHTYGTYIASVVSWLWPEIARQYEIIHHSILRGSREEAIDFRQAIANECNRTAVAGAIIAQVAITALSLPFLSNTHWITRACFLIAVTSGCLSVYYACVLQRIVGKLYNAEQIREWLMVPAAEADAEEGSVEVQGASLAAIFIISAPFGMVKVSIFSFLLGLAIYQGFMFTKGLGDNTSPGDNRNSFIALIVGTGLCSVFFLMTFSAKDIESTIRSRFSRLNESSPHNVFDTLPGITEAEREDSPEKSPGTIPQPSSVVYQ